MSQSKDSLKIAIVIPEDRDSLEKGCKDAAGRLSGQLNLSVEIQTFLFKNNELYKAGEVCGVADVNNDCVGIAYGDEISKWINENTSDGSTGENGRINIPFLLMSAADIENVKTHHLKAFPSATTIGILLAKLTQKFQKFQQPDSCLGAFFEDNEAGRICKKAYDEVMSRSKNPITSYRYRENERVHDKTEGWVDLRSIVKNGEGKWACVYGFTNGVYTGLINNLIEKSVRIVSDVNFPEEKKGKESRAVICGVSQGEACFGGSFFSHLMEALIELLVKSYVWGKVRGQSRNIQEAVKKYGRFVSTSMGSLPFVNDELFVPFVCSMPSNVQYEEIENFREIEVAREAVDIAMTRIESIAASIMSNVSLTGIEERIENAKNRAIEEVLEPCFKVDKVYFINTVLEKLNDSFPETLSEDLQSLSDSLQGSVLQVSYVDRDVENTDVLQLYVVLNNEQVTTVRPITYVDGKSEGNIVGVIVGNDTHDAEVRLKDKKLWATAEKAKKFVESIRKKREGKYLYYVSVCGEKKSPGIVVYTDVKFRNIELAVLKSFLERFYGAVNAILRMREIQIASVKSAIGSIMSRNGSHNIGSHVLAALSHNVGTMPDDRVLYQYIQHRMDYIATVTTDFPTWTQPTMLLGGLMKTFLSQRHLLDHITESEGLSAWKFQGHKLTKEEYDQQHWIKFHVRKWNGNKFVDLIQYGSDENDGPAPVLLNEDVALAIPGGVVGQHAFYTILENFLRNVAKHDWSAKVTDSQHLEIYIDFQNSEDSETVEFCIWSKVCLLPSETKEMSDENVQMWLDKFKNCIEFEEKGQKCWKELPLNQRLQVLIERPFIDADGGLRRENWGLAEMKISAGYLQRRDVGTIGGLGDGKYSSSSAIIVPFVQDKHYLAYKFSVPKPRELLCIIKDDDLEKDVKEVGKDAIKNRINEAKKVGVFIKTKSEIEKERNLNYRYVVLPEVTLDELRNSKIKYPFRVISCAKTPDDNELLKGMVPVWSGYREAIKNFLKSERDVESILSDVYDVWSRFLIGGRFPGKDTMIGLLIAPTEGQGRGGDSLISDSDVLNYVLTECFDVCIDQYLRIAPSPVSDDKDFVEIMNSLKRMTKRSLPQASCVGEDMGDIIARQLGIWSKETRDSVEKETRGSAEDDKARKTIKILDDVICHLARNSQVVRANNKGRNDAKNESGDSGFNVRKEEADRVSAVVARIKGLLAKHPIDGFIEYLKTVHAQTKTLFKQYEENIVSLPDGFVCANTDATGASKGSAQNGQKGFPFEIAYNVTAISDDKSNRKWLAYRRHDHSVDDKILYAEPLSGTQSYLTQLMRLVQKGEPSVEDKSLYTRLLENGLMRILVIDERVAKFVREHKTEVDSIYRSMGISVVDDKLINQAEAQEIEEGSKKINEKETKEEKEPKSACVESRFNNVIVEELRSLVNSTEDQVKKELSSFRTTYEILIVHQGILDKWFADQKNDRTKMKRVLNVFKQMFKYVVITTGRGTPVNIPEEAHLLPFAVVEAALFRKYPEKMILVDTVMNVLAVGKSGV